MSRRAVAGPARIARLDTGGETTKGGLGGAWIEPRRLRLTKWIAFAGVDPCWDWAGLLTPHIVEFPTCGPG